MLLDHILQNMVKEGASDAYLKVGSVPVFRVNGALERYGLPAVSDEDTEHMAAVFMTEHQRGRFADNPDVDLAYTSDDGRQFLLETAKRLRDESRIDRGAV